MGCRATRPKVELVRLALAGDAVVADPDASAPGRGAYVCGEECLRLAIDRRTLPRAFRHPVGALPETLESPGH